MIRCAALIVALAAVGCGAPRVECELLPALSATQCEQVRSLRLEALPPARGNAKGDDGDAALLGFKVFFDARFSANGEIRCATCHEPLMKFSDRGPVSMGLAKVTRRSPSTLNSARMKAVFWDGRADSLWSQALFALENPSEMGFSRLEVAHQLAASYPAQYAKVFGALPELSNAARFPAKGKPGDSAWDQMAPADRAAIDQVAANLGKAFEAYERKVATGDSKLDRFLDGDVSALDAAQQRGLLTLVRSGCLACHSGPLLSDQRFHNLGVPAWPDTEPDPGRAGAVDALRSNPFNAKGPHWDGERVELPGAAQPEDLGAFRTPTLRNVALAPPYMHNGRFATLDEAISFHLEGGGRDGRGYLGEVDALLVPRTLSEEEMGDLIQLLGALSGEYPRRPWNDWPDR